MICIHVLMEADPAAETASTGGWGGARPSLGIERTTYVAISTADPAAAADFAVAHMGLALVHADGAGRRYLAAHGLDPYSLVYVPGEKGIDHVSYQVADLHAVFAAEHALAALGVGTELAESDLWRHEPALRVCTPGGHRIELTPGVRVAAPMASVVTAPTSVPAPIALDHVVTRVIDVDAELAFVRGPLGLRESSTISAPDVGPMLSFHRGAGLLYHCLAVARADRNELHHFQFSLKDGPSVLAAHERMSSSGEVEMIWGPVRHGPGHNIAFYFRDQPGNFVEYSAEEEVILSDDAYRPQQWSVTDQRSMDEWGTRPPDIFF